MAVVTKTPYGFPVGTELESLIWKGVLRLELDGIQVEADTLTLQIKPDDLLETEATYFPQGLMPPIHRMLIIGSMGVSKHPAFHGGLYSKSQWLQGYMKTARELIKSHGTTFLRLDKSIDDVCSKILK